MNNELEFWFRLVTDDSTAFGELIALACKDNCYHCETKFNGRFFSSAVDTGVRFTDGIEHQEDPNGYWDIVRVPEPVTDLAVAWANSILGAKYDYFAILNFALGIHERDPYRWVCSECGQGVADRSGIIGLDPMPSPSLLRYQLKCHLAKKTFQGIIAEQEVILRIPKACPVQGLVFSDRHDACLQDLVADGLDPDLVQKVIARCVS